MRLCHPGGLPKSRNSRCSKVGLRSSVQIRKAKQSMVTNSLKEALFVFSTFLMLKVSQFVKHSQEPRTVTSAHIPVLSQRWRFAILEIYLVCLELGTQDDSGLIRTVSNSAMGIMSLTNSGKSNRISLLPFQYTGM